MFATPQSQGLSLLANTCLILAEEAIVQIHYQQFQG
jgi:hypothetical protein